MTQKGAIRWSKEIKALFDGKTIQEKNINGEWVNDLDPSFRESKEYRIKPESKIVPFDYSDAENLIGKAVKTKTSKRFCTITAIEYEYGITINSDVLQFEELFQYYTFLDGSPCGKVVEE